MPLGMLFVRRMAIDSVRGFIPFIKALVPDDDPHSIAQVEKFGRWRIVAGANRVDAHIAHDLELPFHCPRIEGGAKGSQIMMQIDAVQLQPPAVQVKSVVGREFTSADAERRALGIEW